MDVVAVRRALHRIPELGFQEHRTSATLRELMRPLGPIHALGETGFFVDLGDPHGERTLLLRADMDALPITEETGLSYASVHPAHMHACGHDAHMAALVAAAHSLASVVPKGLRLRILFQPAEEGLGGAKFCIEQGVLDGVDAAFGLHVWSELPVGQVALTHGGIMASVVEFSLSFNGQGGHAALPERARNPIPVMAAAIEAIATLGEEIGPDGVITMGSVAAGDAFNVIPEVALLRGTCRAFEATVEAELEASLRRIAARIARRHNCPVDVSWRRHCRVTRNDVFVTQIAREAAEATAGVTEVLEDYRTMAGEDFGEFLEVVPGAFALVGCGKTDGTSAPHHSPFFDIEESVLPIAQELHAQVVRVFADPGSVTRLVDPEVVE